MSDPQQKLQREAALVAAFFATKNGLWALVFVLWRTAKVGNQNQDRVANKVLSTKYEVQG